MNRKNYVPCQYAIPSLNISPGRSRKRLIRDTLQTKSICRFGRRTIGTGGQKHEGFCQDEGCVGCASSERHLVWHLSDDHTRVEGIYRKRLMLFAVVFVGSSTQTPSACTGRLYREEILRERQGIVDITACDRGGGGGSKRVKTTAYKRRSLPVYSLCGTCFNFLCRGPYHVTSSLYLRLPTMQPPWMSWRRPFGLGIFYFLPRQILRPNCRILILTCPWTTLVCCLFVCSSSYQNDIKNVIDRAV
jgi:hypothetical protein